MTDLMRRDSREVSIDFSTEKLNWVKFLTEVSVWLAARGSLTSRTLLQTETSIWLVITAHSLHHAFTTDFQPA